MRRHEKTCKDKKTHEETWINMKREEKKSGDVKRHEQT